MNYIETLLNQVGKIIVDHPKTVILLFLTITAVFAIGLADIESEEGTQEFAEDVEAYEANQEIDEQFSPPFEEEGQSLQIIHQDENVLTPTAIERNLWVIKQIDRHPELTIEEATGVPSAIAQTIDPTAETPQAQYETIANSPDSEIETAVDELLTEGSGLTDLLEKDYNPEEQQAHASLTVVSASGDGHTLQQVAERAGEASAGDFMVLSDQLIDSEFEAIIGDSLEIVIPVVVMLILLFLILAYRDPVDLLLGLISLSMVIVWTFGFTGLAGIPFSEMMIAIPPLLLAIGVDFGIHAVNRYREERVLNQDIKTSMDKATDQLLVAFLIVAGTTMIGFGANAVSDLGPIAEFGLVAAFGVVFTFLVFGIFLPAMKVFLDGLRETYDLPSFGSQPLGSENSVLGEILPVGARAGQRAPIAVLLAVLLLTAGAGAAATQVNTSFDDDDFLPPEELPEYIQELPDPFTPEDYRSTSIINFIEESFESGDDDQVPVYIEGPIRTDDGLERIHRASKDPPSTVVTGEDRVAESQSIMDVIEQYASDDRAFQQLVENNDRSGNGIPDQNVDVILDELFTSEYRDDAREYITEDYRYATVEYEITADADDEQIVQDIESVVSSYPYKATPAGTTVIYQQVGDLIFDSAVFGLIVALIGTALFLMIIYHVFEGRASIGLVNLVPITVTVVLLVGTMPIIGIPLNAMTATILSITIGVGVAYSVHITHRFIDEYEGDTYSALLITLRGTGGALTGSMLTTLGGASALILAIIPVLGQFGLLMSIGVLYSFLTAIAVLPPTLIVWGRITENRGESPVL